MGKKPDNQKKLKSSDEDNRLKDGSENSGTSTDPPVDPIKPGNDDPKRIGGGKNF